MAVGAGLAPPSGAADDRPGPSSAGLDDLAARVMPAVGADHVRPAQPLALGTGLEPEELEGQVRAPAALLRLRQLDLREGHGDPKFTGRALPPSPRGHPPPEPAPTAAPPPLASRWRASGRGEPPAASAARERRSRPRG